MFDIYHINNITYRNLYYFRIIYAKVGMKMRKRVKKAVLKLF